jgi:uncharacterized BrkB/YihY/UPF0761 family membrane protein
MARRFGFRDPPFKWRTILVAAALAQPGYLAGGLASLYLGDFETCSVTGAMLGAVIGACLEFWPQPPPDSSNNAP